MARYSSDSTCGHLEMVYGPDSSPVTGTKRVLTDRIVRRRRRLRLSSGPRGNGVSLCCHGSRHAPTFLKYLLNQSQSIFQCSKMRRVQMLLLSPLWCRVAVSVDIETAIRKPCLSDLLQNYRLPLSWLCVGHASDI